MWYIPETGMGRGWARSRDTITVLACSASHRGRAFTPRPPSTLQGPLRLPSLMLRRKYRRSLHSLKKPRPASLPADSRRSLGASAAAAATPQSATSRWTAQDVTVTRGQQAMFSCTVNFQLPKEEITYSWRFAGGGLRTQDPSYFRNIPRAEGYLARIRPVQPTHRGTFSCVIKHDQRLLARLYFFLNGAGGAAWRAGLRRGPGSHPADVRASAVTGSPPIKETELQSSFREVLLWAPREAEMIEPWRPSLGELLATPEALTPSNQCLLAATAAIASASLTLLAWMFFRWYFSGN
ncbi:sperm acrosome membrane-associated protein 6 isoform X4 [Equus przewalskii]|uniref:Sperm acrosome membrane-associated protein 6 isoform X4 n=1 Tax=Equus przewalskii TaxID=9798 RepID=A0ABM4JF16_EQUPR|nr:sperm acrosome membrane-associated protein 6 isoform X4 [Equus caballus]